MKNRKIWLIFILFFTLGYSLILTQVYANSSISVEWVKSWGGSEDEILNSLTIDLSDNIYLGGYTWSFGAGKTDLCLVKFNNSGDLLWNVSWGGSENDYGYGVATDSSENVYIMGTTHSFGAQNGDVCLLKYDHWGTLQWNTTWGNSAIHMHDRGLAIAIDTFNKVYIAGYIYNTQLGDIYAFLAKFDSSGVQLWNRTWGNPITSEYCNALAIDSSDNIYMGGWSRGVGPEGGPCNITLVKYDSTGSKIWEYIGHDYRDAICNDLAIDTSDNIYLAGSRGQDAYILKFDSSGTLQWENTWDGGRSDLGRAIALDSSNNIYIVGMKNSMEQYSNWDIFFLKCNNSGVVMFNASWGGNTKDYGTGVALDSSNNIFVAGYSLNYTFIGPSVLKTNSNGDGYDFILMRILDIPDDVFMTTIPGYDPLFLIGLICGVSVIILEKSRKKK